MEMNSHSYATLAAVEESGSGSTSAALGLKDTSESSGCWPFVFDQGSQKDLFHTSSSSDVMVDPSQLQSSSLMPESNNTGMLRRYIFNVVSILIPNNHD